MRIQFLFKHLNLTVLRSRNYYYPDPHHWSQLLRFVVKRSKVPVPVPGSSSRSSSASCCRSSANNSFSLSCSTSTSCFFLSSSSCWFLCRSCSISFFKLLFWYVVSSNLCEYSFLSCNCCSCSRFCVSFSHFCKCSARRSSASSNLHYIKNWNQQKNTQKAGYRSVMRIRICGYGFV